MEVLDISPMPKMLTIDGIEAVTTSEIQRRFGVNISAKLIEELQVEPFARTHVGIYWRESDIPLIATRLAQHLMQVAVTHLQPATKQGH